MDRDFEIELQEEMMPDTVSTQLPVNFLAIGEIENDDVKVYIKQDVYKALEKLSSSDTSKELGSIIIGDYNQELGKSNVIISAYIEAKYTDASAATLTFTHETWDYIHLEQERLYRDKKIIGWQHTHPNYGIFLSNYDMFIQENFFNLPFQIAYVIDPIQNIRGFFQWKNGKIEKLNGYYIYDDVGKPIKIEQIKVKKENTVSAKTAKAAKLLIALLCLTSVLLGAFAFSMRGKYEKQLEMQNDMLNEIQSQKEELADQQELISAQADTISQLQELVEDEETEITAAATDAAAELNLILDSRHITPENREKALEQLAVFMESRNLGSEDVRFRACSVVGGDCLYEICAAYGLDYNADIDLILAVNGITDANEIYAGQTIYLPEIT